MAHPAPRRRATWSALRRVGRLLIALPLVACPSAPPREVARDPVPTTPQRLDLSWGSVPTEVVLTPVVTSSPERVYRSREPAELRTYAAPAWPMRFTPQPGGRVALPGSLWTRVLARELEWLVAKRAPAVEFALVFPDGARFVRTLSGPELVGHWGDVLARRGYPTPELTRTKAWLAGLGPEHDPALADALQRVVAAAERPRPEPRPASPPPPPPRDDASGACAACAGSGAECKRVETVVWDSHRRERVVGRLGEVVFRLTAYKNGAGEVFHLTVPEGTPLPRYGDGRLAANYIESTYRAATLSPDHASPSGHRYFVRCARCKGSGRAPR